MDLQIEKQAIARELGKTADADTFHLQQSFNDRAIAKMVGAILATPTPRMKATCDAIRIVHDTPDVIAIGMAIGPFSLATKLLADPITPVFLAGSGTTAEEDPEVALFESTLLLAAAVVEAYVAMQIEAGAAAIVVCEPAANVHYLSPNQIGQGSDIFERFVMQPNRELKQMLDAASVELIFHDCGELTDDMVRAFGQIEPAVLSLGSSRKLWEDAALLPETVVLFGNLPSKRFYSDEAITLEAVEATATELRQRMAAIDRPFILGTECDVLSVPGCEAAIASKVDRMMACGCDGRATDTNTTDARTQQ
jgi:uroporphyrinogen-III decarboxylase